VKTLVIGLGNPILGDDGVGWRIAETVQSHPDLPKGIEFDFLAVGGISLMERLIGYDQVILIDAIVTHQHPVGTLHCFKIEDLPSRDIGHLGSPHDTSLQDALKMGRELGAELPEDITVIAIETQNVFDFSEELTPQVAAMTLPAAQRVIDILNEKIANKNNIIVHA
jgi:hydrogenase maturation protease